MSKHNSKHPYRLFVEAERLEAQLLRAYYTAKTRERHHRLLSICDRAHKRKIRRREVCLATTTCPQPETIRSATRQAFA